MTPERLKQLTKLANSESYSDRLKAAQALDLPLELQEILVRDEDDDVRYWLAMNTSVVNVELQGVLARDEKYTVRWCLAWNPSFTDRKLWELLRDDEEGTIRHVINDRIEQEKDRIKAEFKNKILK